MSILKKSTTTVEAVEMFDDFCGNYECTNPQVDIFGTGICRTCGTQAEKRQMSFRDGTFVFEVEANGKTTRFSSPEENGEEFDRKLKNSLYRLTGYRDYGWGHYGTHCKTGGLNVEGKFSVTEIK